MFSNCIMTYAILNRVRVKAFAGDYILFSLNLITNHGIKVMRFKVLIMSGKTDLKQNFLRHS